MRMLHRMTLLGLMVGLAVASGAPPAAAHTGVATGPCPPSYPLANMPAWVVAEGTVGPPGVPLRSSGHVDAIVRHPTAPGTCIAAGVKWAV